MLIVCGIVLMASVFSGCTEAGANILMDNPEDYIGKDIIELTNDIAENPSTNMISSSDDFTTYELNGLTIDVSLLPETAVPHQIEFTDEKGNSVRLTENGDPDTFIDTAEIGKNGIYPTDAPTTAQAKSTTQPLSDAPSGEPSPELTASISDSDINFADMSPVEAYRAALDNPDAVKGINMNLFEFDDTELIKEIGTNKYSAKQDTIDEFTKRYNGINYFVMDTNGVSPTKIIIRSNDGHRIIVVDNNNDGLIDIIAPK